MQKDPGRRAPVYILMLHACAWFAGEAGDRIFHKTGSKQQQGSTGLLTRGMVDRDMFYGHAMILAMVPFINPDLY